MQLLVRVVDKFSIDPVKDYQLTKRGDVIAVKPDNAGWGLLELINPDWRIISVPDMSQIQAEALLVPESPSLNNPQQACRKRSFKLDLAALSNRGLVFNKERLTEKDAQQAIMDRKIPNEIIGTLLDLNAAKILKVRTDPSVIGEETPVVIGA